MVCLKKLGVELLLIALFCLMSVGFLVTYVLAVHFDHVSPYFPYISDTGSDSPESCIFSFVCSVGAILVLCITYVRHKQLHEFYINRNGPRVKVNFLNHLTSFFGVLSALGLLMVGSFQDDKVAIAHFIGAYLVFGFGIMYGWFQLLISYQISRFYRIPMTCMLLLKLAISVVGTCCFIGTLTTGPISVKHFKGDSSCNHCWDDDDGGYALHLVSTVMEWIMSLSFLLYFLTFYSDFMSISVDVSIKSRYDPSDHDMHVGVDVNERTPLT